MVSLVKVTFVDDERMLELSAHAHEAREQTISLGCMICGREPFNVVDDLTTPSVTVQYIGREAVVRLEFRMWVVCEDHKHVSAPW